MADLSPDFLATLGAGVATAGAFVATAFTARRSSDRAEVRYRKNLGSDLDLVAVYEAARRGDSDVVVVETNGGNSAPPTPQTKADVDPRHRMASLPVDYHAQVLAQSRQSFIFSLGAAAVGFVIIAISILLVLADQVAPGVASMVGAAIAEAVAALFFAQSNRARTLMSGQLEGFRAAEEIDRQASERKELIQLVEDPEARDALITQTVLVLAEPDRRQALPSSGSPRSGEPPA